MNKLIGKFLVSILFLVMAVAGLPLRGNSQTRHSRPPGATGQTPPASSPSGQAQAPAPAAPAPAYPAPQTGMGTKTRSTAGEEFFITTSVDATKHQLVLKRPTEVTLLIQANDQTTILGENGEHLKLGDLRTGDTVFVTFKAGTTPPLALKIRKAPMTVAELHRRYLTY